MTWGIVVEWDEMGLTCCGWMRREAQEGYGSTLRFSSRVHAETYIATLPEIEDPGFVKDRICTAREFGS